MSDYGERWERFVQTMPKRLDNGQLIERLEHHLLRHPNGYSDEQIADLCSDFAVWLVEQMDGSDEGEQGQKIDVKPQRKRSRVSPEM